MWWVIIRLAKLLAWFRFQESVRKIIGQMHGCVEKDFLIAVLGEEICNDNVVDSSHDRSSTRSNFFKFSYQSANIVKTNHGMSHVIHLTKPRSRIVDYWIDIAAIIGSMKPPHWQRSVDCRRQWSLNVWYGIVKGHLVNLNYLMEH